MAIAALDPVTQEILSSGFHHIAEEMAVVEYRSSYSPIIREMLDFNCGLFTADGRIVANSEQIPAQLGLMQFALESVLGKWRDDVAEGDAFLTNNPYMGGTHTPDLQVFTPLFDDGQIVAWAGSIAHLISHCRARSAGRIRDRDSSVPFATSSGCLRTIVSTSMS